MDEEKKKESKFHFVSAEEISATDSSVLEETNESNVDRTEAVAEDKNDTANSTESVDVSEEIIKENSTEVSNEKEFSKNHFGKVYFSFEVRVVLLLLGVLILVAFSCYFFYRTATNYTVKKIDYDESSNVHYKVCMDGNSAEQSSCLGEGIQYSSNVAKKIQANFEYDAKMVSSVDYDISYHVVAVTRIVDSKNSEKDLYKTEDTLVGRKVLKDKGNEIKIDSDIDIDISKYNAIVEDYKSHYSENVSAAVDIILYLEQSEKVRDVASITIPLDQENFSIGKFKISNINQSYEVQTYTWNRNTIFYSFIASILLILSMIVLYKMAHLVYKVTNNRNVYQTKLSQILREYDRIIVVARDGYTSDVPKTVIKVNSFNELLNAREILEKPIIYSKVNSVKSEFIVEDDEKLYKYVLKEADL